jgi:hypothetical protein
MYDIHVHYYIYIQYICSYTEPIYYLSFLILCVCSFSFSLRHLSFSIRLFLYLAASFFSPFRHHVCQNLSTKLLLAGLQKDTDYLNAVVASSSHTRVCVCVCLQLARTKRLRTWEKYDQELEAARAAESAAELVETGSTELGHVTITEMISPVSFWAQVPGSEKQIDHITERLAAMNTNPVPGFTVKTGETCVAKFSADGAWYRAVVESRKGDKCTVRFIDFGNMEDVSTSDMRPLGATVPSPSQIPAQAIEYKLAYIKVVPWSFSPLRAVSV